MTFTSTPVSPVLLAAVAMTTLFTITFCSESQFPLDDTCCMRDCRVLKAKAYEDCEGRTGCTVVPCEGDNGTSGFSCGGPEQCEPYVGGTDSCCQKLCTASESAADQECQRRDGCEVEECVSDDGVDGFGCGSPKNCHASSTDILDNDVRPVAVAAPAAKILPTPSNGVLEDKKNDASDKEVAKTAAPPSSPPMMSDEMPPTPPPDVIRQPSNSPQDDLYHDKTVGGAGGAQGPHGGGPTRPTVTPTPVPALGPMRMVKMGVFAIRDAQGCEITAEANDRGVFLRCLCGPEETIQAEFVVNEHRPERTSEALREGVARCLLEQVALQQMCSLHTITADEIRAQTAACCEEGGGLWKEDIAMCG